jgi:hypothetical protein
MRILATAAAALLAMGAGALQPQTSPPAPAPNPHAQPKPHAPGAPAAPQSAPAQPDSKPIPPAKPEDVGTVDALIKALYQSTAGPIGKAREWDRFRSLFVAEARMIPIRHAPHGEAGNDLLTMPVESYIQINKNYFEKGGFFETEAARRTETFGNIAQVWSTFESRRSKEDPQPYARGVYSIQLAFNGQRWFIINVMWDTEQEGVKLPEKYLKSPSE